MQDHELPATANGTGIDAGTAAPHSDLVLYLFLVRRFWWLVLGAGLIAAAAAWQMASMIPPSFTAEVLLQKTAASPLAAAGLGGGRSDPLEFGSELEIIRSRSVLVDIVESLGLQLRLEDASRRSQILAAAEVVPDLQPRSYLLAARGDSLVILDPDGEGVVAAAASGDWLEAPGFRLRVRDAAAIGDAPVAFQVTDRQRAVERLQNRIRVEPGKGIDLIHVSYRAEDPVHAAAVVNAVAESYAEFRARTAREAAGIRRAFLEGRLAQLSDSLRAAQERLLEYQETERILDPDMQRQIAVTGLVQSDDQARELRFQEQLLENLVDALESPSSGTAGLARIAALGNQIMPGGVALYNRLRELETERERLTASRFGYTDAGPAVEVVDSLIESTRADIRILARQALDLARERRIAADSRSNQIRTQIGEIPERAVELVRRRQQVDAVQRMFDLLLGRFYEAQIAEAVQTGDVDVVDQAPVPLRPDEVDRTLNAAIGLLGGLFIGLSGLGIVHYFDNRVRSRGDAERAAHLPILGLIPHVSAREREHALARIAGIEAFRSLGIQLGFAGAERRRVLAITSAAPGESKSTVAANLAVAMAKCGSNVLLVDTDLRRPILHRMFNCRRSPGLTEVVEGKVNLESAVLHDDQYGLDVLTCGAAVKNPPALLASIEFAELLERLRGLYKTIILDTAPLLAVADSSVVCSRADGALLVVRANRTTRAAIRHAIEQLRRAEAAVLGTIIADIPADGSYARTLYGYSPYYAYYGDQPPAEGADVRRRTPRLLQNRA